MENKKNLNSKVVKAFTKGSLVILGLFVVLSHGLVAYALFLGNNCLACGFAILQVIVLGAGFWSVARFHDNHYVASYFNGKINSHIDEKIKASGFNEKIDVLTEKVNSLIGEKNKPSSESQE